VERDGSERRHPWAFLTTHAAILLEVHRRPQATVRELAAAADVTERQAHRVLGDLAASGYITRTRVGRRNTYQVNETMPMRLRTVSHHQVGELLAALAPHPPRP
jgi:DeoR/GlpR family transcriptional regulator of sugar metabolism